MRFLSSRGMLGAMMLALAIGGVAWSFAPDAKTSGALLHPANPIIYLSFDGGLAHEAEFKKTAAYQAIYESGLMDMFLKVADRLKQQAAGEIKEQDARLIAQFLELGKEAMDKGGSFSAIVAPPAGGPPTASATLILNQCGRFRGLIEPLLKQAVAGDPSITVAPYKQGSTEAGTMLTVEDGPMGGVFTIFELSGHLVINASFAVGGQSPARDVAFKALSGEGPNVSSHRLYQDGAKEKDFVQNSIGWFDFKPLKEMFGGMPLPPTPTGEQMTVADLLKTLGLDTLEAVVARSGYRDRAQWSEARLIAPGPRKGLMALLDQPTFTFDDLPPLPAQPLSILATSVDAGAVYDTLVGVFKDMSAKVEPNAIDQFDQGIAQAESQLGFSIRKDLLEPLKGIMAVSVDGGGSQSFDAVLISLQVQDQARFKATLQRIFAIVGEQSRGEVVFENVTKYNREMFVMKIRQAPIIIPTICVDKKFAHIGLLPQAIDMALLRTDGRLPTWKPAGDTADGLKLLPKEITSLSFSDTPTMYSRLIGQAPLLLGLIQTGMAQANPGMEFPLRAEDLPPSQLVAGPLFPNLAVSTVNDNGMVSYSRSSMPGSEMFLSVGGAGVMTALLLPAVQSAREAARRTESKNNLKQIGLALHNYHDVYNAFPTGTVPNPALKPEERLSWLVSILPFVEEAPLFNQIDQKVGWDKGANEAATATGVSVYLHPNLPQQAVGVTSYVGIAGLGEDGPTLDARNPKAGVFAYDKKRGIRDIIDGTSNTAMVAESSNSTPWAGGGPGTIRPLTKAPYINGPDGIGGVTQGGANVLMADGAVRFVSENVDPKVMEALSTIAGGEPVDDF